ncbi:MAG TPA: helix-turn-helix domain-containing protein [Actinomycetota bacterium]|nr:helix-turn-helix domain-containing protein [Actinomycetota bacterium]
MSTDDALYRFRLRVFALAEELGNARAACRAMGIHPSTYYRLRRQMLRFGPEILRPRERRGPRMPNATSSLIEQRVLAFASPPRNPSARFTSSLAHRVAADLARRGWRLGRVMTDNASESARVISRARSLGAHHVFIRADRPRTNGCVERVQRTVLDECWKPAFARYLIPKYTGLRIDLDRYVEYYNTDRAHTGRWTRGRTPEAVLGKEKMWSR